MSDFVACRSPWIEQLDAGLAAHPLSNDVTTDVAVIGAGIAGVSTAFFLLRDTDLDVVLIERDQAGRGATGHNAGQLTTYFERPLHDLVDTYGFDQAIAAQRAIDETWDLLDAMVAETGATVAIECFVGSMAMFTLDHVTVHLRSSLLRRAGGLRVPECTISADAPFLDAIPAEYADLYSVVPAEQIRELLGTTDDHYCAAMSDWKGCANGALLVEQVLASLHSCHPDRFKFADHTPVDRVALDREHATITAGGYRVTASYVVMCTNGFVDHVVENLVGEDVDPRMQHRIAGDVGYMVGFLDPLRRGPSASSFIRNEVIGGDTPYVYTTTRAYESPHASGMLTCIGGPEHILEDADVYDPTAPFPAEVLAEVHGEVLPLSCPDREPGLAFDFAWHGLMAYSESRVRMIGFEPKNPILIYNLGCNGVGFLPSIYGGYRVSQLINGHDLEPTIFDPP